MTHRLRLAQTEDHPFVATSWLQSYASSDWATLCTPFDSEHVTRCDSCGSHKLRHDRASGSVRWRAGDMYWQGHKTLIRRLIATSNVTVAEADDGLLDGWICRDWHEPVLHFVYVRKSARERGLAKALVADLADAAARFTHWPRGLEHEKLPDAWTFDLYPLTRAA